MKYSLHISLLLAIIVSFVLGWRLNTAPVEPRSVELRSMVPPLPQQAGSAGAVGETIANSAQPKAQIAERHDDKQALQVEVLLQAEESASIKTKLAKLANQLANGEHVSGLESQLDELMGLMRELSFEEYWTNATGVASQILSSPALYKAFLDHYPSLSDQDQRVFSNFLLDPNSPSGPFRENYIVEQLKVGEHTSIWLKVLGERGIRESSTFDYLIEQMGSITDSNDLAAVISASSSISELSFKPAQLEMPKKDRMVELYEPYFESENEAVRTAALGTLVAYPRDNEIELLQRAFTDDSTKFRYKALEVLISRPIASDSLQRSLYNIIRDQQEVRSVRRGAAIALQNNATTRPPQDVIDIANQMFRQAP